MEDAAVVVETEEERADRASFFALVPAEAADDAVNGAQVLDLGHGPDAGLIAAVETLGNDAVKAGTFEAVEPVEGGAAVVGGRRQVRGWTDTGHEAFEAAPAFGKGRAAEVGVA